MLLASGTLFAQDNFTITGTIKDAVNGERLVGAAVYVQELKTGAVADLNGNYTLNLKKGNYTLVFSFLGHENLTQQVTVTANLTLSVTLTPSAEQLSAVEITDVRGNRNVAKNEMGAVTLNIQTIRTIPTLMGEVDVIKSIQLLPGIMSTGEGGSGFSVRGGAPDQNLIMMDGATVYNASHCLGFFSVFNNDAIKDVTVYKGDMPVQHGGRLASVLDIQTDGGGDKISGSGGIGLLSSRLTVKGYLWQNRTNFMIAGRRTYFDLFLPLANSDMAKNSRLFFWDVNVKITHKLTGKDQLELSAYKGLDVVAIDGGLMGFDYGNQTASAIWRHTYNSRFVSNVSLLSSVYDYGVAMSEDNLFDVRWDSKIVDYGLKAHFIYQIAPNNTLYFGGASTFHKINLGKASQSMSVSGWLDSTETVSSQVVLPTLRTLENALYISHDLNVSPKLLVKYGLRLNGFFNIGADTVNFYDENYNFKETKYYKRGEIYHTSWNLEPRVGLTYIFNDKQSVKAGYSRTVQYMQLASSSSMGNPLDVWFPTGPTVKPQRADMFSVGYFRNFKENKWETSVELYYKKIYDCIDFKDQAEILLNPNLFSEVRIGTGRAYGAEFMVKKPSGILNGWISYTLSRSERQIATVNDNQYFLAPYDRTHNLTIVLNWQLSERSIISMNWVYYTGNATTFPSGRSYVDGVYIPVYTDRNSYRMPDYHRMDVSYTLKSKVKPSRKWDYDWNFGVYNIYNQHNAWMIMFERDSQDPTVATTQKLYLFGMVPSITFNFRF
ncbi:collagen-binding protein [Bacteroidia bacterium]|nr:collagen-binding protein [Bacteroidia bacterium]